ncbi:MAG: hypothetical protein HYU75_02320 [Betaproteobacteria bacterium]|nr:hypothetical protein [Betaproteobacteria bacterium]
MVKRAKAAVTICSTAFETLGRSQARALGCPDLPLALVPHPFGIIARDNLRPVAEDVAKQIEAVLALKAQQGGAAPATAAEAARAKRMRVPGDVERLHRMFMEEGIGDGLPVIPPTPERVARMLTGTSRTPDEVIAALGPAFGLATVEHIAINAVMAGCRPEAMELLISIVDAIAAPDFNLQGIQATTNPAAVWAIVSGPVAKHVGVNAGTNCLGPGTHANSGIGRALRLMMLNIGGATPGLMDRATQGQPGKFSMVCAENEDETPWQTLGVERGIPAGSSSVTMVGFSGTLNMNTHSKDPEDILRSFADALAHAPSNDYWCGGEPWVIFAPEHANILSGAGYSKSDVKQKLWERTIRTRKAELGVITADTLLPISTEVNRVGVICAGGPGTHSVYVPGFGNSRSVTRPVRDSR